MPVTRINLFKAHEDSGAALRDHLRSFIPLIRTAEGCISCELLAGEEDSARVAVIEVWESIDAHRASVALIPPGTVETAMKLLAEPPAGAYYHTVEVQ